MAKLAIINILPKSVADLYYKLKIVALKLHKTTSSIAFLKKVLFNLSSLETV